MTEANPLARAWAAAHVAAAPHVEAQRDKRVRTLLDGFEGEFAKALRPQLAAALADENITPALRELYTTLSAPEQAVASGVLGAAVMALMFPIMSAELAAPAQAITQSSLAREPNTPLPPAEIALGAVRNTLGSIDPHAEGLKSGYDAARMDVLCKNTGDVPSLQELLLLLRRKQITDARFVEGLHLGRLRDDWITEARELAYGPPSAPEVLAGRIEGFLDDATAQKLFAESGLNPANYAWMLHTAGRSPGTEAMLQLFNRGLIPEDSADPNVASLRGSLRESNVKDKYIDAVVQTRVYLPPVRSIPTMLRHNSITEARARELLKDHGVQPADIDGYVAEANSTRTTAQKELSASQAMRAYELRLITQADATARITKLGYSATDAALMLQIADDARHAAFVNAAVSRVHAKYVSYQITRTAASTLLDHDAIPPAARDDWLKLWDAEREAVVPHLTLAEVNGLLHRGTITDAEYVTFLQALGWPASAVPMLASLAFPPTKVPANLAARFGTHIPPAA